ncbi:MAG: biotin--[acetyl-CoA-carboxylase] ligase [Gammaproteobacteria bacterium]|jgi:BirA family biotin operon repressor/biotin-[acetyl-CoA-carboxylase] ligase|nr:biotin--[acetyl-CoA-carboxylase] ligase [Gammaproteobacteria bacterium]
MPEQLKAKILKAAVAERCALGMDVQVFSSIDSTNSWSLLQCKAGKSLPFACFAEEQTHGRGRRGKQWLMPARTNIAMSLSWSFDLSHNALYLLPLSISVAIAQSLESFGMKQVQIKWPNDIYVSGKKIAGILIETRPVKTGDNVERVSDSRQMAVVIGVGLNYDMTALVQDGLQEKIDFTDICEQVNAQYIETGLCRAEVAASLLYHVVDVCQNFQQRADRYLEVFRSRYDFCRHKNVEIMLDSKQILAGVAQGVTDRAELLVTIEGEEQVFNSADVSVRTGQVEIKPEKAVTV